MVNNDETWHCIYDQIASDNIALLKFAKNWKVKKFIYAASEGRYCCSFENYFFYYGIIDLAELTASLLKFK